MTIGIGELILRLATSVLLGSAIGYEREMRERPAGLRTHLLVSLASATFMLIRIDCVGEFVSRAQLQQALGSIGATVADIDYARDLSANRSRTNIDVRLPRHDVEEAVVKILEGLPSVQKVRVRRPWV